MKNALKLSLVLGSLSILYLILGVVNYFYPLPAYETYSIVSGVLTLVFFSLLLRDAASTSPLKWPLRALVAVYVLNLVCFAIEVGFMLTPVVDEQSYQTYVTMVKFYRVAYVIYMFLLATGFIWLGMFFRKGSAVQISSFLIPLYAIADFVYAHIISGTVTDYSVLMEKQRMRMLVSVCVINTLKIIFYYSFYNNNKSYGRD